MRKVLILSLFFIDLFSAINVAVSIVPQKSFVKAIGKDKVNVFKIVPPGFSPHIFEPKPMLMTKIAKADIYFLIGVEFEKIWSGKFADLNKNLLLVDMSKGIKRYPISSDQANGKKLDPHVWLSFENIKVMAKNILSALIKIDPKNKKEYEKNYKEFIKSIEDCKNDTKNILKNIKKGKKFMVFHPSWGYFAKEFDLVQLPIEVEGKEPKPKELIKIYKTAKKEHIKTIFASKEFSDKSVKKIAKDLNINVVKISPLDPNWCKNLKFFAKSIADNE